jgi:hypothetical protein
VCSNYATPFDSYVGARTRNSLQRRRLRTHTAYECQSQQSQLSAILHVRLGSLTFWIGAQGTPASLKDHSTLLAPNLPSSRVSNAGYLHQVSNGNSTAQETDSLNAVDPNVPHATVGHRKPKEQSGSSDGLHFDTARRYQLRCIKIEKNC